MRSYDLGFSITKLAPSGSDRDYENHLEFNHDATIKLEHVDQPKIAGTQALVVRQSGERAKMFSRELKSAKNEKDGTFILANFARGYEEQSQAILLLPRGKVPPGLIVLNGFYGVFVSNESGLIWQRIDLYKNFLIQPDEFEKEGTEFIWEIRFMIYPVQKGEIIFTEGFRTQEPVSHFDGFQSFLLQK